MYTFLTMAKLRSINQECKFMRPAKMKKIEVGTKKASERIFF